MWRRIGSGRDLASGIRLASAVRQVGLECASSAWITGPWPTCRSYSGQLTRNAVSSELYATAFLREADHTPFGKGATQHKQRYHPYYEQCGHVFPCSRP